MWGHKLNANYWFDRKDRINKKHEILLSHIKKAKEILMFGDTEIEKNKNIYRYWESISI